MTIQVLVGLQTDDNFDIFFNRVLLDQKFDVDEPATSMKRRAPQRLRVGTSEGDFPESSQQHYCQLYYEALDDVADATKDWFNQPGYRIYDNLQDLILKAAKGDDFTAELWPLFQTSSVLLISDIVKRLQEMSLAEHTAYSDV